MIKTIKYFLALLYMVALGELTNLQGMENAIIAIKNNDKESLENILKDPAFDKQQTGGFNKNLLQHALDPESPHPHIINTLLKAGVNPDHCDEYGLTSLHYAANHDFSRSKNKKIMMQLLQHGNPNASDVFGETPFHHAMRDSYDLEVIVYFLLNKGNPLQENSFKRVPLSALMYNNQAGKYDFNTNKTLKHGFKNFSLPKPLSLTGLCALALLKKYKGNPHTTNTIISKRSGDHYLKKLENAKTKEEKDRETQAFFLKYLLKK
jgi:ankyrin repeat protein